MKTEATSRLQNHNPEFLQLHAIDYKGRGNSIKKKRPHPYGLLILWLFLTCSCIVGVYFSVSVYKTEAWKDTLIQSITTFFQQTNVTTSSKFLKQLDQYLYKRKGTIDIQYSADFTAWIVLTVFSSLSWILTTMLLGKELTS